MKMLFKFAVALVSIVLIGGAVALCGQDVKVDPEQPQKLLAAGSTTTLQLELDKAGALGFHVISGTTRSNGEIVLLLERNVNAREQLQIKLIATTATGTFQDEITKAARQGFRAVPGTLLNKPSGALIGNEIVVVLERPVNVARRYEYKILATNQTSALEAEWRVATTERYKTIGMLTRLEVMVLMERETR